MAIISCPFCRQQISDKSKICKLCHSDLGSDNEAVLSARRETRYKVVQSIQLQQLLAILLVCGGFIQWNWQDKFDLQWYNKVGIGMLAIGLVWYMGNRVRVLLIKRAPR